MKESMITDWKEALEIVVERTKHERYRVLTADDHPGHVAYRKSIIAKANNLPPPRAEYEKGNQTFPTFLEMAGSVGEAAKRLAGAWWNGDKLTVTKEEMQARLEGCFSCGHFNQATARCNLCGCFLRAKTKLKHEHCPRPDDEGGPKW
jgi:hypothetical protein